MKISLKYAQLLVCISMLSTSPALISMTKTKAKTSWYLQGSRKILVEQPRSLSNSRVQSPTPLRSKKILKPLESNQSVHSEPLKPKVQADQKPIIPFTKLQSSEFTSEKSTPAKHYNQTDRNHRITMIANILRKEEKSDFSCMANLNPTVDLKSATILLREKLSQERSNNGSPTTSVYFGFYEDTDDESDNENINHILFINDGKKMNQSVTSSNEGTHHPALIDDNEEMKQLVHLSSETGSTQLQQACSRLERESAQLQQSHLQGPEPAQSPFFLGDIYSDYSPREDSLSSSALNQ